MLKGFFLGPTVRIIKTVSPVLLGLRVTLRPSRIVLRKTVIPGNTFLVIPIIVPSLGIGLVSAMVSQKRSKLHEQLLGPKYLYSDFV